MTVPGKLATRGESGACAEETAPFSGDKLAGATDFSDLSKLSWTAVCLPRVQSYFHVKDAVKQRGTEAA